MRSAVSGLNIGCMRTFDVQAAALAPSDDRPATMGLHGHQITDNAVRAMTAEAVGTFTLVLAIGATAVSATSAAPIAGMPFGSEAVALVGVSRS
jgi:glycerol uptake facilitator-like aquaporin